MLMLMLSFLFFLYKKNRLCCVNPNYTDIHKTAFEFHHCTLTHDIE